MAGLDIKRNRIILPGILSLGVLLTTPSKSSAIENKRIEEPESNQKIEDQFSSITANVLTNDFPDSPLIDMVNSLELHHQQHFFVSRGLFVTGDCGKTHYGTSLISFYQTLALGLDWEIRQKGFKGNYTLESVISDYQKKLLALGNVVTSIDKDPIEEELVTSSIKSVLKKKIDNGEKIIPGESGRFNPIIRDMNYLIEASKERDKLFFKEGLDQEILLIRSGDFSTSLAISLYDSISKNQRIDLTHPEYTEFVSTLIKFNKKQFSEVERLLSEKGYERSQLIKHPLYNNFIKTDNFLRQLDYDISNYGLDVTDLNANLAGALTAVSSFSKRTMNFLYGQESSTGKLYTLKDIIFEKGRDDSVKRGVQNIFAEALNGNKIVGYYYSGFCWDHKPEKFRFVKGQMVFEQQNQELAQSK